MNSFDKDYAAGLLDNLTLHEVDDVLDDLATLARKVGGQAVIVPAERMPTKTGIAAIYRY